MPEADDAYTGNAGKAELVAFLNELLEAERAGARVTLKSAREPGLGRIAELIVGIYRPSSRWRIGIGRRSAGRNNLPGEKHGET